jgi:hypothetical protein
VQLPPLCRRRSSEFYYIALHTCIVEQLLRTAARYEKIASPMAEAIQIQMGVFT